MTDVDWHGTEGGPPPGEDAVGAWSSRRTLLRAGLIAGVAAVGAATGAELISDPAGAAPGDPVKIDQTTTGAGGTTVLEYTSGSNTLGSVLRAALQDWGGQVYNVMAYGATGNGSTDDTAAILAAQQAAGSGCVLFPPGTYQVSGLTISTPGQTFKLESGATIRANASIAGPVITVSAGGVTILGPGTIDGNASAQTGTNGLDCVRFVAGGDDGLVHGLVAQNAAWLGIETDGAARTRIVLNQVLNCTHGGISCNATTATIDGPLISGNRVFLTGGAVSSGINVQGPSSSTNVNYADVSDNQVEVAAGLGYQVSNCNYARVVGNRGKGPSQVFSVVGGSDNLVSANSALATGPGAGIELGSNYSTCVGNTVAQSGTGAGIHADNIDGTHVIIANNNITGAVNCGIGVGSYDHVTITGNVIHQSTSASASFSVIQVSPANAGLILIADNILDAAGASSWGIWLNNLTSTAVQTVLHDNAITGVPTGSSNAAFRFAGAGTVTDLLVHDNTIGAGTPVYSMAPGLTFGSNVRFSRNIIVGGTAAGLGVTPVALPPSGTAYTNPGPYSEVFYVQGGKLIAGTGTAQGVVKDGHVLVPGSVVLKTPVSVVLNPGEALTVYYSVVPTAWKDVKG